MSGGMIVPASTTTKSFKMHLKVSTERDYSSRKCGKISRSWNTIWNQWNSKIGLRQQQLEASTLFHFQYLFEIMQSSPIEQPIPSTAASTIHRFPIEQWDPIVNGAYFDLSSRIWQGCSKVSSPINVYFWIWTGARSALIVTPSAMKQRPSGISRDEGIWITEERLMTFRVDVKMYLSMLNVTSGLYISLYERINVWLGSLEWRLFLRMSGRRRNFHKQLLRSPNSTLGCKALMI
jgi:hypothetical protein